MIITIDHLHNPALPHQTRPHPPACQMRMQLTGKHRYSSLWQPRSRALTQTEAVQVEGLTLRRYRVLGVVLQADLHDASVVFAQLSLVVDADARAVDDVRPVTRVVEVDLEDEIGRVGGAAYDSANIVRVNENTGTHGPGCDHLK